MILHLSPTPGRYLEAAIRRDELTALGHAAHLPPRRTDPHTDFLDRNPDVAARVATDVHAAIRHADGLIVFGAAAARVSTDVELGIAIEAGVWPVLIGQRRTFMHCHPAVETFASWESFLPHLAHKAGQVRIA